MDQDRQHLQLLSVIHYVLGGLFALMGCFPIFHVLVGIAMVSGVIKEQAGEPSPQAFGWIFIIFPGMMMLFIWGVAFMIVLVGRKLATYRSHMFCLVAAAIECTFMPLGTLLGVFTILVLIRPSVKSLFGVEIEDGKKIGGV